MQLFAIGGWNKYSTIYNWIQKIGIQFCTIHPQYIFQQNYEVHFLKLNLEEEVSDQIFRNLIFSR